MVRHRSRKVEVDGAVYQVRAQSKEDGRVQVKVRGGGEAVGELVAPADHLAALGRAVGESEAARGRTVEELAHLFGRKPSAIQSRLRHLKPRG